MATTVDGEVLLQLLQEFRDFRLETRTSFQRLDSRMDALEGRMDALEECMDALERRMDALEEQIQLLDRRVSTLEVLFEALDRRMGLLDQRVGSLELLFGSLDQRVGSLEVMVTHLHVTNQRPLGYLKRAVKMLIQIAMDRGELDARLDNHERRLLLLEK